MSKVSTQLLIFACVLLLVNTVRCGISSEQYVGNSESKMLHAYDCNHLPEKDLQVLFPSLTEAEKAGYKKCPLCFKTYPEIAGYGEERFLGREAAARLRYYYPFSIKGQLQEKVEAVGRKVLAGWPLPKRGYSYEFQVLESEEINAWALPSGFIYVSSELLNTIESDEELEAILAHEIAHIEERHGYREYQSAQGMAVAKGVLGIMATAAGTSPGTVQIVDVLCDVARQIVVSGYSRNNEEEADIIAKLYLAKIGKTHEKLVLSLKKIKYLEERERSKSGGIFSAHPDIDNRIHKLEATMASLFEGGNVFTGLNQNGDKVAELCFLWQKTYRGTLELHAVLKADKWDLVDALLRPLGAGPPGVDQPSKEIEFTIFSEGKKMEFQIRDRTVEGLNARIVFATKRDGLLTGPFRDLRFTLPGVERWEIVKQ